MEGLSGSKNRFSMDFSLEFVFDPNSDYNGLFSFSFVDLLKNFLMVVRFLIHSRFVSSRESLVSL